MTNLLPYATIQNTAGDGPGAPGAAPNGAQMLGNPQSSQFTPNGNYPPNPLGARAFDPTANGNREISQGQLPVNVQPTAASGINSGVGNDSLMAMLSRGQVILNLSTYGQGNALPVTPGAVSPVGQSSVVPVGGISAVAGSTTYLGN